VLILASAENVAYITGGATVIAALILGAFGALAAERRLTKQINDAADRQKRELDADARQQRADLEHDRELADLADLRKLLDEAAVAVNKARNARDELIVAFSEHGTKLSKDDKDKLALAGQAIDALNMRILVRLGVRDPISEQFAGISAALLATWREVSYMSDEPGEMIAEKHRAIRAAKKPFDESMAMFLVEAVKRAGTVPTKPGASSPESSQRPLV
jgi:uncharacterized membrane protein